MKTNPRFALWAAAVVWPAALWAADSGAAREIDIQKSVLRVRVFKSGLFSAFGHEHDISAPIESGLFNESRPTAELTVDARKMRVMDKDVSKRTRQKYRDDAGTQSSGRRPVSGNTLFTAVEPAGGPPDSARRSHAARPNPSPEAGRAVAEWPL
jgi:hypothetical protein